MNPETETHKGTGFVRFENSSDAQRLIDLSQKLEDSFSALRIDNDTLNDTSELELKDRRLIILPTLRKNEA